jgi:hypothetical protein
MLDSATDEALLDAPFLFPMDICLDSDCSILRSEA